jgi:23S rRNA pseudouridine2605 synthase
MERLHKVIASYGYASRRKAEKLIKEGKVSVNEKLIKEAGFKVYKKDVIKIDGVVINKEIVKKYYLLNKPRSVISSTTDDLGRITVVDLIDTNERIFPVGRLDYDTTGLILLTNDGEFANYITHPSNNVTKTYYIKIKGILDKDAINKLKKGIMVENKKVHIKKFKIKEKDNVKNVSYIEIVIHEGRNHIVKNIFKELGYEVLKLKRTAIGDISLGNLQSGEYRELNIKEYRNLTLKKNN